MKHLVDKLKKLERSIAGEKGEFSLFALVLPDDSPDRWDLVVAAPWIDRNTMDALRYLARRLGETLKPAEMLQLSRIAPLKAGHPVLMGLRRTLAALRGTGLVVGDMTEFKDVEVAGLQIKHVYFIHSPEITSRLLTATGRRTNGNRVGSAKASRTGR